MMGGNLTRASAIFLSCAAFGLSVGCGDDKGEDLGGGTSGTATGGGWVTGGAATGGAGLAPTGGSGLVGTGGTGLMGTGGTGLVGTGGVGAVSTGGTGAVPLLTACALHACVPKVGDAAVPVIDPIATSTDDEAGTKTEANATRVGYWYVYQDNSPAGEWTAGTTASNPILSTDAQEGSAFVVTGQGFSVWGAGMGVSMDSEIGAECPYDASMYGGVRFYAKGTGSVRFSVKTAATSPCNSNGAGLCDAAGGSACDDHFSMTVALTSAWTEHVVCWNQLARGNWGTPTGLTFDPTQVMGVQWQALSATTPFTIGVDELSFATTADCP